MRNYEVPFIVDPVLSGDEIKATAQTYVKHLEKAGCKIVHFDEMGLLQLAYPINRRTSGIYFCVEFEVETGALIDNLELAFRRDERIMRFLTVSLDKYGVKYNDDKRSGKIGKVKKTKNAEAEKTEAKPARSAAKEAPTAKAGTAVKEAPVAKAKPAPVVEEIVAPVVEETIAPVVEETVAPVVEEAVTAVEAEPVVEETVAPVVSDEPTDEVKSEEE
jgi:small subunit ribosomal protein S6